MRGGYHICGENQMRKKRPGMLQTAHRYIEQHRLRKQIGRLGFELLDNPPYSPDLAPCDFFFLFPLTRVF